MRKCVGSGDSNEVNLMNKCIYKVYRETKDRNGESLIVRVGSFDPVYDLSQIANISHIPNTRFL